MQWSTKIGVFLEAHVELRREDRFMQITRSRSQTATMVACVAAALSVAFAVMHVAWAAGWRGGVPADIPPIADRPVFLTYDLVAAGVISVGAVVFVLSTIDSGSSTWRRKNAVLLLVGSCAALARGVPAAAMDLVTAVDGGQLQITGVGSDVWFTVIGAAGIVVVTRGDNLKPAT